MKTSETCESCVFYKPHNNDEAETFGECRRYPPQVVDGMGMDTWPRVGCSDWCGEFKKRLVT